MATDETDYSAYETAAGRFREAIRTKHWDQLPGVVEQLRDCLAARDKLPARGVILDLLASAAMVLDDDSDTRAERALKEAAEMFDKLLMEVCSREDDDKREMARQMATEIRKRFQQLGQYRSVRPILREIVDYYTDDLVEFLIRDGDAAQDGFILEVMNELGERLVNNRVEKTARLRTLIQEKRFSSNEEIRSCADRLLGLLDEGQAGRNERVTRQRRPPQPPAMEEPQ
jgi:hypothetical protein